MPRLARIIFFLLGVFIFFSSNELSAQMDFEFCQNLKDFGKFYENQDSTGLQSAKLFLSYQHQVGHIDGTDKDGNDFDDSFEEFRRFWVGFSGNFATYWKFKAVSQLSNDRHAYPGDYRQWGHETFRSANITFDADGFWEIEGVDSMELGYGRRTGRMADEWQRSSTVINCLERSSLANKLWLYDKEKGNPLAVWIKWSVDNHAFDTAVFSGTYDDYLGGWEDSRVYYASWLGDFSSGSSYDLLEYWISYYGQVGDSQKDHLAGGMDWSLSLVNRLGQGPWALHSTLAFGDNGNLTKDGSAKNNDRSGNFWGAVLMPMYWLQDKKFKLVVRYLYQNSNQSEGLKLNSRYVPLSDSRDSLIDLNQGYGDSHRSFYVGLNYYLCAEHLKIISGVQHDHLKSLGISQYRGWTLGTSLRIWF